MSWLVNFVVIASIMVFCPVMGLAQTWIPQTSNGASWLSSVAFVDDNNGWAVGGGGTIRHTTNGGAAWTGQTSGTGCDLAGVDFVDATNGWAVSGCGYIHHTSNGGAAWDQQGNQSNWLTSVAFPNANYGWAVSGWGEIRHTTNGGSAWTYQVSGTTNSLWGVAFADASNGWAVGEAGTIRHTSIGGIGWWIGQTSGTTQGLRGVAFVDASNGWAVGEGGTIRHTSDGGNTWTGQTSGTTYALNGVAFVDPSNGWAVGEAGTIRHTANGGSTWSGQTSGTTYALNGVAFVDANNGWAVGDGGTILRYCLTLNQAVPSNPANGATVCSGVSQVYSWGSVSGATLYRIQWANNPSFSSPITDSTANTSISRSLTGSGTWYWHVRAENACGPVNYSASRTIALTAVPSPLSLSSPSDGAVVCSDSSQTYSWTNVSGAATYRIQWANNPSFSSPITDSTANTSISRSLTGSGIWYWRVRAENICGQSSYSPYRTVSLTQPPGAETLLSPSSGTTVCSGASQAYCWNSVAGATSYHIQWADTSNFSSVLTEQDVPVGQNCISEPLTGTGIVYWRVEARNNSCGGGYSTAWTISLAPSPEQVTLSTPTDSGQVCINTPQAYNWNSVVGATQYRVQWADNTGFSPLIAEQTLSMPSASQSLSATGTVYWRVRVEASSCGSGLYSSPWTANVVTLPGAPSLSMPTDGAQVCSDSSQSYSWSADTNAIAYHVQWADNIGFSPILLERDVPSGTSTSVPLTGSGTVYWRVSATGACGTGGYSAYRSVALVSSPVAVILASPAAATPVRSDSSQTYAWSAASGATTYVIQWANDSVFTSPTVQMTADTTITQTLSGTGTWYWHVRGENSCGDGVWSASRAIHISGTSSDSAFGRSYPNPYNPDRGQFTFRYRLTKAGNVTITVYDVSNVKVASLAGGVGSETWDGKNSSGNIVANGIYFYVVESSSGERKVGKVAVVR